jgi:hypothetical protein
MPDLGADHDTRPAVRFLRRPTPAGVLAFIALSVAIGGTALAATGQLVNIADPGNAANVAKVDGSGRLTVGDGAGAMTVDGTVTSRETPLANLVHIAGNGGATTCQIVSAPPAGKAWVLKSLSVSVDSPGSTPFGPNQFIAVMPNTTCSFPYATVFPLTSVGLQQWNFEPGLAVPAGGGVAVYELNTTASWHLTAEGYSVPAGSVPAAAAARKKTPNNPLFTRSRR